MCANNTNCNDCFDTSFITLPTGATGATGPIGPTGATGATGAQGSQGPGDGYTMPYKFSDSTLGYAGNTYVSLNNADVTLVTELYVAKSDLNAVNNQALLLSFVNNEINALSSSNNRYGILKISNTSNPNTYINYEVLIVQNDITHVTFTVKYLDHTGTLVLDNNITVNFKPFQSVTSEIRYEIFNWNMDTTSTFNIPIADIAFHGVSDYGLIIDVSVMIKNDSTPAVYSPLTSFTIGSNGAVVDITDTNIVLQRTTGGKFDDANYSAAGFRGYALIKYFKF